MDQRFTHPGNINPQLPLSLSWYTVNVYVVPKMVIYQFTPSPWRLVTGWYLLHGNVTPLRRVPHSPIHSNNWKRTMFWKFKLLFLNDSMEVFKTPPNLLRQYWNNNDTYPSTFTTYSVHGTNGNKTYHLKIHVPIFHIHIHTFFQRTQHLLTGQS